MLLQGVAQRKIASDFVSISAPVARSLQRSLAFQFADNPVRGPFSDADLSCHVAQRCVRIGSKAQQYMRVISEKCPCRPHVRIVTRSANLNPELNDMTFKS